MAQLKTRPTRRSVSGFLSSIADDDVRRDCRTLSRMMREATRSRPKMWGASIVGFGTYTYRYRSGREGEWFLTGFSPRKRQLSLYVLSGFKGQGALLRKLGKHRSGKGCLYVKSLDDLHLPTLRKVIVQSARHVAKSRV